MLAQDLARIAILLFNNRKQQVLGGDEFVLHLVRLFLRGREQLAQARAEVLLSALYAWKPSDCRLRVVKNDRDVGSEFAEYWSNNAFRLFQHHNEQVLGLNLLVLVALGELDGGLNCFLSP